MVPVDVVDGGVVDDGQADFVVGIGVKAGELCGECFVTGRPVAVLFDVSCQVLLCLVEHILLGSWFDPVVVAFVLLASAATFSKLPERKDKRK